jgi:hypothetical protein
VSPTGLAHTGLGSIRFAITAVANKVVAARRQENVCRREKRTLRMRFIELGHATVSQLTNTVGTWIKLLVLGSSYRSIVSTFIRCPVAAAAAAAGAGHCRVGMPPAQEGAPHAPAAPRRRGCWGAAAACRSKRMT